MAVYDSKQSFFTGILCNMLVILFFAFLTAPIAFGAENASKATGKAAPKIHISADKLTSRHDSNMAVFSGNVKTTVKGLRIDSDSLTIYYKSHQKSAPNAKTDEPLIERIIAVGHVRIRMDNKTAVCDRAEYTPDTGLIVLSGSNTEIKSANNYINGKEISINRDNGDITVVGNAKKRVQALFRSDDKQLMKNSKKKKTGN